MKYKLIINILLMIFYDGMFIVNIYNKEDILIYAAAILGFVTAYVNALDTL